MSASAYAHVHHSARELIHVATCVHHGIRAIIGPDTDFDRTVEVERIPTEDRAWLGRLLRT